MGPFWGPSSAFLINLFQRCRKWCPKRAPKVGPILGTLLGPLLPIPDALRRGRRAVGAGGKRRMGGVWVGGCGGEGAGDGCCQGVGWSSELVFQSSRGEAHGRCNHGERSLVFATALRAQSKCGGFLPVPLWSWFRRLHKMPQRAPNFRRSRCCVGSVLRAPLVPHRFELSLLSLGRRSRLRSGATGPDSVSRKFF